MRTVTLCASSPAFSPAPSECGAETKCLVRVFRTRGPGGAEACQRALIVTSHDVIVEALVFRQQESVYFVYDVRRTPLQRCSAPLSASVFQPFGRLTGAGWKVYPDFHPEVNKKTHRKETGFSSAINSITAFELT